MVLRGQLLGATLLVATAGCVEPGVAACSFLCEVGDRCPLGLSCGDDGYCHDPDDPATCGQPEACVGCVPGGPYNIVFISSPIYLPGELGGLDGADAECQRLADEGDLPGRYRAWLSTSSVDAASRLVTPSGDPASGWVRPDGRPVAASLDDLLSGRILFPPRIDDRRRDVYSVLVATGTTGTGAVVEPPQTSGEWSVPAEPYRGGLSGATTSWWTDATPAPGDVGAHLYCFGVDHARPFELAPTTGRTVFVSTGRFSPDSGIAAADAMCMAEATALELGGTFRALLSTTDEAAAARFDSGPTWVRLDGVPWLESAEELSRGNPLTAANLDSSGEYLGADMNDSLVWAGGRQPSSTQGDNCLDWSSALEMGIVGIANYSAAEFFDYTRSGCGVPLRVYCLQD